MGGDDNDPMQANTVCTNPTILSPLSFPIPIKKAHQTIISLALIPFFRPLLLRYHPTDINPLPTLLKPTRIPPIRTRGTPPNGSPARDRAAPRRRCDRLVPAQGDVDDPREPQPRTAVHRADDRSAADRHQRHQLLRAADLQVHRYVCDTYVLPSLALPRYTKSCLHYRLPLLNPYA